MDADISSFSSPKSRSEKPGISCVIPALNEHDNLVLLLPKLAALLGQIGKQWEIIVVDDGSTDRTTDLMREYTATPGFLYLQLSRNFGKEAALSAGLDASRGDVVVSLDADMQHPLTMIPQMLERWKDGADMVYAVRDDRSGESWVKRAGSAILYHILQHSQRIRIPPNAGDFRLMDRQVVNALVGLHERTRFMKGLYAWVGFKAEPIRYVPAERLFGQSNYSLFQLTTFAMDGISAFSTWPLRALNYVGWLLSIPSFIYAMYLITTYFLHGHEVSGWTTIVTTMFLFSGINLIALGTISAYVARIFDEVKQRPVYIVKQCQGTRQILKNS